MRTSQGGLEYSFKALKLGQLHLQGRGLGAGVWEGEFADRVARPGVTVSLHVGLFPSHPTFPQVRVQE